jgi:hypothetical protein
MTKKEFENIAKKFLSDRSNKGNDVSTQNYDMVEALATDFATYFVNTSTPSSNNNLVNVLLTGSSYRPFYPQDSLSWTSSFTPIDIQEECNFYISGSQNELIYKLKNNKIYSADGELISNYNNNQLINFSGNISDFSIDLYKDNLPLFIGKNRKSIGDLSGFIFELNKASLDLNLVSIVGEQPEYFVDSNIIYSSGVNIPINISHNGLYDIIIYSGASKNTNYSISGANNLIIPPSSVSTIYLVNNFNFIPNQQILSVDLHTNIGLENIFINISGEQLVDDDLFYINLSPPVNGILVGTNLTYALSFANQSGSNIEVSLEYISGVTGKYYKSIQNTGYQSSGNISGFISGAGLITGFITGGISGFNILSNEWESGIGTGFGSKYYISDNKNVTGTYSVLGTGRGDVEFITNVAATGFGTNIKYSGFISYQGGTLTGYSGVLGTGQFLGETYEGILTDGISKIFSPYTGTVIAIFNPDEYDAITLSSPIKYVTGTFTTGLTLLGFGYATGKQVTGFLQGDFGANDYEPGFYKFEKQFTGPVTGSVFEYSGLNPITTEITNTITTGLISTNLIYNLVAQGCKIDLNFNLTGTGIPLSIRRPGDTGNVYPVNIFNTFPFNTGEWPYENLDFQTGFGTVEVFPYFPTGGRTRISRPGPTVSGTGYYNNIFQKPFFTGNNVWANDFYGWKESIESTKNIEILYGDSVSVAYVSGLFNLFNESDSAIIDFTLTGGDSDFVDNIKFYFNTQETGKILITDFYKVTPTSKDFLFSRTGGATTFAGGRLMGANFFEASSLLSGTGDYQIVMSYENFVPQNQDSYIVFSHNTFTGCEKDGKFVFEIAKSGFPYYQASGTITAKFTGQNYPDLLDGIFSSGIVWNWELDTLEYSKYYGFDIFKNNRYQTNWGGQLGIQVKGYAYNDPFTYLDKIEVDQPADFVILDDDKLECTGCRHSGCLSTIDPRVDIIYPIQKDLGPDLRKIEEIYPDSFAVNPGGGGSSPGGSPDDSPDDSPDEKSNGGGDTKEKNPFPPNIVGGSSDTDLCCINPGDLTAQIYNRGSSQNSLICNGKSYVAEFTVCINGFKCEQDRSRHYLVTPAAAGGEVIPLGFGNNEDFCGDAYGRVSFNLALGSELEFVGYIAGSIWQCGFENESIRRVSFERRSRALRITNNTTCPCCDIYNLYENDHVCPVGEKLEAFNDYDCPEGRRTCYKCVPDESSSSSSEGSSEAPQGMNVNDFKEFLDILIDNS